MQGRKYTLTLSPIRALSGTVEIVMSLGRVNNAVECMATYHEEGLLSEMGSVLRHAPNPIHLLEAEIRKVSSSEVSLPNAETSNTDG